MLKDNKYEQMFNPSNMTRCECFDEDEFSKNTGKATND